MGLNLFFSLFLFFWIMKMLSLNNHIRQSYDEEIVSFMHLATSLRLGETKCKTLCRYLLCPHIIRTIIGSLFPPFKILKYWLNRCIYYTYKGRLRMKIQNHRVSRLIENILTYRSRCFGLKYILYIFINAFKVVLTEFNVNWIHVPVF